MRELQAQRLRATARRCYEHVPFYKRTFDQLGISPDDLGSTADVAKLPFTTKADLRDGYPTDFWTIGRKDLVRVHGSSGTTGKSTLVAYTQADMDLWGECVARFLTAGGATSKHMAQVAFGYGLFTGGFGLHYGLERIGVAVVPAGAGNTRRQITLLQDLEADLLICTPSYALTLAEAMREAGVDPNSIRLSMGHFGGEPWTDAMARQIEAGLGIHAYNNYGLSEIIGPGVSGECRQHTGMHIAEDHFLAEIIDPDSGQALPEGETGELVLTTLTRQGMPMIRYRTRDITSLDRTQCGCGRWAARMARVMGRTDDMLIIRGVNVYPSQVEQALMTVEGILPFYRIVVDRKGTLDEMTVQVEVQPELFSDEMKQMTILRDRIEREVHSITGIRSHIQLMEPNSLERSIGKAVRVQDNRTL